MMAQPTVTLVIATQKDLLRTRCYYCAHFKNKKTEPKTDRGACQRHSGE